MMCKHCLAKSARGLRYWNGLAPTSSSVIVGKHNQQWPLSVSIWDTIYCMLVPHLQLVRFLRGNTLHSLITAILCCECINAADLRVDSELVLSTKTLEYLHPRHYSFCSFYRECGLLSPEAKLFRS